MTYITKLVNNSSNYMHLLSKNKHLVSNSCQIIKTNDSHNRFVDHKTLKGRHMESRSSQGVTILTPGRKIHVHPVASTSKRIQNRHLQ